MHQREQEECAHRRRTAAKLNSIANEIDISRRLVEAAEMAAHSLLKHERDPLVTLLAMIGDQLKAASTEIMGEANQEATADVA